MTELLPALFWLLMDLSWAQEAAPGLADATAQLVGTASTAVEGGEVSTAVRLVVLLTGLSFIPGVVLLMTPFTRFVIVFSLLRQAMGLQQSPPNQVLVAMSLILAMVIMTPTLGQVNDNALEPYMAGELETTQAVDEALGPMREFMLTHTTRDDLASAMRIAKQTRPQSLEDIPTPVVITGFVLSELRAAFVIGVKIYIPFLVVDLVVASVLLGMGMMMLPPVVISLPFKLMVFVLMDGWVLLIHGMVGSF